MFQRLSRPTQLHASAEAPANLCEFAAFLANRTGGPVVDLGCSATKAFASKPEIDYVGFGPAHAREHRRMRFAKRLDDLRVHTTGGAIVLCHRFLGSFPEPDLLAVALHAAPYEAILVSELDREMTPGQRWSLTELGESLRSIGLRPSLQGHLNGTLGMNLSLVVCRQQRRTVPKPSVVAIMTAYNEADIVSETIPRLVSQGVAVYLIDNWSEDGTADVARSCGAMAVERFPKDGPSPTYDWHNLLSRVEQVATEIGADWVLHHDADEVRMSPFEGTSLLDGISIVDAEGYNAIDFTVADFPPVDESFDTMHNLDGCFPGFAFGTRPGHFIQVKAWKNTGRRVQLAESGGHNAVFEGRRVYPYKFLLRHYPVRSQAHGMRKILRDRMLRWNSEERAKGWHRHYDAITPDHCFLRDVTELTPYISDTHFAREFLIERLSGVGIPRT